MRSVPSSSALAVALGLVASAANAQTLVLDATGDTRLVATIQPAPENGDPALHLSAHVERHGKAVPTALDGRDVSFARLLPDGRFLAITPAGALQIGALRPGAVSDGAVQNDDRVFTLDTGVFGAVGTSPDGRHWVYCKGAGGDTADGEVYRIDDGRVRRVTSGMAPAWSPAISPDGRRVVFVSAYSGVPVLYVQDQDAAPVALVNGDVHPQRGVVPVLAPTPDALTPPLVSADRLVFEARGSVHILDTRGHTLRVLSGRVSPFWAEAPGKLGVFVLDGSAGRQPGGVSTNPEIVDLPPKSR